MGIMIHRVIGSAGLWAVVMVLLLAGCRDRASQAAGPATVPTTAPAQGENVKTQKATFAMGCFWGSQATFDKVPGVVHTEVGYEGGTMANPTYHDVCTDKTGHAEVVQVEFDPAKVSYQQLLTVFFENHDPTTPNSQGPDHGTQYRSAIFFNSPEQEKLAKAELEKRDKSGDYVGPIVTQIVPAANFYKAEDYHQEYFQKEGTNYVCHLGNGKKTQGH
jgi:peptide-methionine (S)-S-oxide reductase